MIRLEDSLRRSVSMAITTAVIGVEIPRSAASDLEVNVSGSFRYPWNIVGALTGICKSLLFCQFLRTFQLLHFKCLRSDLHAGLLQYSNVLRALKGDI